MENVKKAFSTEPTAYRALVGLAYPTDPKIHERLVGGEDIPWDERGLKEVPAGSIVNDIPESSTVWLLEQGLIEVVTSG